MAPLEKWLSAVRVGVPQGPILSPYSDRAMGLCLGTDQYHLRY